MPNHETRPQVPDEVAPEMGAALINELDPYQQDLLGLVALGLTNQEMALKVFYTVPTIKVNLKSIYGTLEVGSRFEARAVASAAGLLERAYSSEGEDFPETKKLIEESGINLKKTRLMDKLALTMRDLTVLELTSRGLTIDQIGKEISLSTAAVKSHKQVLYKRLGKEKAGKVVQLLAYMGKTASHESVSVGV